MIQAPLTNRQSRHVLSGLLLSYWLGSTALLTLLGSGWMLVKRQLEVLNDAHQVRDLVTAALATPMTSEARQILLQEFARTARKDRQDSMSLLLVLNPAGRIVYSSRSGWVGLSISDQLLNGNEAPDPDFRNLIDCFVADEADCMITSSSDLQLHTGSFTVVRPVVLPRRQDLGVQPDRRLLVVHYGPGAVLEGYGRDLGWLVLFSLLLTGLLTLAIGYLLVARLLPQLAETAQTDGLTQLINRTLFMEQAKEWLADAQERQGELVFAILDIDHFKQINDTFGHSCGDAALTHVAVILRTVTRPDDLVCRFGGEEFALILNGSRQAASSALERLRLQLEMSRFSHGGQQLRLNASIGAAATAECGYNIDYLYNKADKALYKAKHSGRNRLEWSEPRIITRLSL